MPKPVVPLCGRWLDDCVCRSTGPVALDPEAMQARHRASVERARRSGWASWLVSGRPLAKPKRRVRDTATHSSAAFAPVLDKIARRAS